MGGGRVKKYEPINGRPMQGSVLRNKLLFSIQYPCTPPTPYDLPGETYDTKSPGIYTIFPEIENSKVVQKMHLFLCVICALSDVKIRRI